MIFNSNPSPTITSSFPDVLLGDFDITPVPVPIDGIAVFGGNYNPNNAAMPIVDPSEGTLITVQITVVAVKELYYRHRLVGADGRYFDTYDYARVSRLSLLFTRNNSGRDYQDALDLIPTPSIPDPIPNFAFNPLQYGLLAPVTLVPYVYYSVDAAYVKTVRCWKRPIPTASTYSNQVLLKPQIRDYFTGYSLDANPYIKNIDTTLNLNFNGTVKLHYYFREDETQLDSDGVAHPTISIQTWEVDIRNNKPFRLKFTCVPCSISLEGDLNVCNEIKTQINNSNSLCFPEDLQIVKTYWLSLYESRKSLLESNSDFYTTVALNETPYLWAATARWDQLVVNDLNTGLGIGENIDDSFVFDKYFKLNVDGTYGDTMADSALLKLIGSSVNAAKWGVNPDDPTLPRVDNLGWRINRLCDITGIRVKPDGTIDEDKDKKLARKVIYKEKDIDKKKIGIISYGELGMVIKRITNRFKGKDEIVSDQCVIVQDIPQMIQEYFEQINLALGIQESSAIEIKQDGTAARFNSQLEVLIELVNLMSSGNEMTRAALVSSLVTQSQTNELIAGLGLPSVTKTIPIKIGKKVSQVPFKGIAAHRSIAQEVATCTYNVGIVLGQVL
jgi:hypothetical protein